MASGYERGAQLGCPDCVTDAQRKRHDDGRCHEPSPQERTAVHLPEVASLDLQDEPKRTHWLNHARRHLADVIAEVAGGCNLRVAWRVPRSLPLPWPAPTEVPARERRARTALPVAWLHR